MNDGVIMEDVMTRNTNTNAHASLALAGALWGVTIPLSKLSLGWLGPWWLTVARFAFAAPILALAGRRELRGALSGGVAAAGAVGFGAVMVLQNVGVELTSVTHAAMLMGAVPVLVALLAAALGQPASGARAWVGYLLALGGVGLVAGSGGHGSSLLGDLFVLASAALSAGFIALQPRLLHGRDAAAVTAVQFGAGGLFAVPVALLVRGLPGAPAGGTPVLALVTLAVAGTVLPFWLFAFGQARVPAQLAGAYVNLEPVVGAAVGWLLFGDGAGAGLALGATAVLAGILLSARGGRARPARARSARARSGRAARGGAATAPDMPRRARAAPPGSRPERPERPASAHSAPCTRRERSRTPRSARARAG